MSARSALIRWERSAARVRRRLGIITPRSPVATDDVGVRGSATIGFVHQETPLPRGRGTGVSLSFHLCGGGVQWCGVVAGPAALVDDEDDGDSEGANLIDGEKNEDDDDDEVDGDSEGANGCVQAKITSAGKFT